MAMPDIRLPETFVVAQADGKPLQPDSLTQDWARKISKTSLPQFRFRDLRHAHATHLLRTGVHPKVASERLGHSKISISLDLYSHVLPGMQEDAADRVDAALQAAIDRRSKDIRWQNGSNRGPFAERSSQEI